MFSKTVVFLICLVAAVSAEQIRPCVGNDFACIQDYLAAATGKSAANSVQDELINEEPIKSNLPAFGINMVTVDSYSGLADATFTDLFIEGSYTVLVLNIPILTRTADGTALFFSKGAAPVEVLPKGNFVYNNLTLTIVFPSAGQLNIDDISVELTVEGEVVNDFSTLVAAAETSEVVATAAEAITANIDVFYREVMAAAVVRIAHDYLLTNVLA